MAQIKWQSGAKQHFRQIFEYYVQQASMTVALSFEATIFEYIERLYDFPLLGKLDTSFSTEETQYYFLVVRWRRRVYKIYYVFEDDVCYIQAIWDCSMNPEKLPEWLLD